MRSATNSKIHSAASVNDLPLDALARIIERDIVATLGGTDLPSLLQPVDYLLQ